MKKTNGKNKKKKLSSLVLLLFLTVVLLATSTYAWFTSNKNISIEDINVNVAAKGGVQISTNAVDWKTIVQNTDITTGAYSGNTNQLPSIIQPVSTDGTLDGQYLNMFLGTVTSDDSGNLTLYAEEEPAETATTSADFVAFDIFLKTDAVKDLYLNPGSGVTYKAETTDKGLQNAARFALVYQGTVDSTAATSAMTALSGVSTTLVTGVDRLTIYEPNYNAHTATGVTQYGLYYTDYTLASSDSYGMTNTTVKADSLNKKLSYDGVKAVIAEDDAIALAETNATDNATYFATVTTTELPTTFVTAAEGSEHEVLFEDFPAGVSKFRVYMWVEGQDVDCENNASGSNLTFTLDITQAE